MTKIEIHAVLEAVDFAITYGLDRELKDYRDAWAKLLKNVREARATLEKEIR